MQPKDYILPQFLRRGKIPDQKFDAFGDSFKGKRQTDTRHKTGYLRILGSSSVAQLPRKKVISLPPMNKITDAFSQK